MSFFIACSCSACAPVAALLRLKCPAMRQVAALVNLQKRWYILNHNEGKPQSLSRRAVMKGPPVTPTFKIAPERAVGSLGQLGRTFWPYFRPFRRQIIGAVLVLVMVAGALLVMGRGLAYLVDEGLSKQDPELLNRALIATALIALCLAFGSYLRTTLVNQVGEQVLAQIARHCLRMLWGWPRDGSRPHALVIFWPASPPIQPLCRR